MKIMDKALNATTQYWEDSVNGAFLQEMMKGTLSDKKFLNYMVQDSIYLRDYLKAYAMAIFKSRTWKEMQTFYSVLGFVNDSENVTRLKYLGDHGMNDADVELVAKQPACEAYTRFLVETAEREDVPEILMSVMPCMVGYLRVFSMVKAQCPTIIDGYYGSLVSDYTSEHYKICCDVWSDFANKICEGFDAARTDKLVKIFIEASKHELDFWIMAGNE